MQPQQLAQTNQISSDNLESVMGEKANCQSGQAARAQAQGLNLHYHQLLSQARHECLMKERVDKRDDFLLEKNTTFSSSGSWSSDLPLDYHFYNLKKKKLFILYWGRAK